MNAPSAERLMKALIGLLLAVFVFVIYDSVRENLVVVGDTAPAFTVTTDSGRSVSVGNFGGRLLVLNFWATWCPPCIQEIPSLNQFQKRFQDSGVVVLGVSIDKDEKAYRNFLGKARVGFLTSRDPEAKINGEYGTAKVPETYIIDTKGKVVQKLIGPQDWNDPGIVRDVEALLRSSPS
jgi:peroxiredoxin